jgi:hypothetical protein
MKPEYCKVVYEILSHDQTAKEKSPLNGRQGALRSNCSIEYVHTFYGQILTNKNTRSIINL